jgi:uncharacterized protein YjgD (DUF1641 family)
VAEPIAAVRRRTEGPSATPAAGPGPGDRHQEAIAEALALLEALHQSGILTGLKALAEQSGAVARVLVEEAARPENTRAIANLFALQQVLGRVEPEVLLDTIQDLASMGQEASRAFADDAPLGIFALLRLLRRSEVRRGVRALFCLLARLGQAPEHGEGQLRQGSAADLAVALCPRIRRPRLPSLPDPRSRG